MSKCEEGDEVLGEGKVELDEGALPKQPGVQSMVISTVETMAELHGWAIGTVKMPPSLPRQHVTILCTQLDGALMQVLVDDAGWVVGHFIAAEAEAVDGASQPLAGPPLNLEEVLHLLEEHAL